MPKRKKRKNNSNRNYNVIVSGAGAEVVNGVYELHGVFQDSAMFVKSGLWKGRKVNFTLFRCRLNDLQTRRWYISITPKKLAAGTKNDIDFYFTVAKTTPSDGCCESPTEKRWMAAKKGLDPPPTVTWQSDTNLSSEIIPESTCLTNNSKMLFSEKFSDIHFLCPDGTVLYAHKIFLAVASPYFQTAFEGPWGDEHPKNVWKTSNSAIVMKIVLAFIYTGERKMDEISKHPFELLALAHEYQLALLVQSVEFFLMQQIDDDNVKECLQMAVLYDLQKLKLTCFKHIQKNALFLVTDKNFVRLAIEDEKLWSELRSFLLENVID